VESKQAVEKLLPLWGQEVGVDDALELLGPGFTDKRVRAFAVKRLERADDDVSLESAGGVGADNEGASAVPFAACPSTPIRKRRRDSQKAQSRRGG
jgi:hypothetical protein